MALEQMKCPICCVTYGLEEEFHKYRIRGGKLNGEKANWFCPNGHSLIFTETEADTMRRERDLLKQRIAQKDDEINRLDRLREDAEKSLAKAKAQAAKQRIRAHAGLCSCCNRHFSNLERHMASKHKALPVINEMAKKAKVAH